MHTGDGSGTVYSARCKISSFSSKNYAPLRCFRKTSVFRHGSRVSFMTTRGSLFYEKHAFFAFKKRACVSVVLKTRLQQVRFYALFSVESAKVYTAKGNVQQNGQFGRETNKTVLKNRLNLHYVYPFKSKNFGQRKKE